MDMDYICRSYLFAGCMISFLDYGPMRLALQSGCFVRLDPAGQLFMYYQYLSRVCVCLSCSIIQPRVCSMEFGTQDDTLLAKPLS